jgi:hypothetical protein
MELLLKDIVVDTFTNTSGEVLYMELKTALNNSERVVLSFKGCSVTSTSFLNSSFAVLIEEMGLDEFKKRIVPKAVSPTQAMVLKKYVNSFRKSDAA